MIAARSDVSVQPAGYEHAQAAAGSMSALRDVETVDAAMDALPLWQRRWCGMDRCECSGCARAAVSRGEWLAWFIRHQNARCERCQLALWAVSRDGRTYLACEVCNVAWA